MPRKNVLSVFQIITDGNMAADITSLVTSIQYLDNIGIQLKWTGTGTPIGDIKIQVSANYQRDDQGNVLVAGDWVDLNLSPAPAAASVAGGAYIDLNQLSAPYIRVFYDRTSGGTGALLQAYITAKQV